MEHRLLLPEDIVFDILIQLPVISLLRCKPVCKAWRRLIESSNFVQRHLHRSKDDNNYNLVIQTGIWTFSVELSQPKNLSLLYAADAYQVPLNFNLDAPCFRQFYLTGLYILTCNGIVCLYIYDSYERTRGWNVALWNPATRQFRLLPNPSSPHPTGTGHGDRFAIGFGYDVNTNDYKVIRIWRDEYGMNNQVVMYSLNTDSWRVIDGLPVQYKVNYDNDAKEPHRNGATYYWVASGKYLSSLLSFDFNNETFATMPLPPVNSPTVVKLAVIKEDIACITMTAWYYFEVWVLHGEYATWGMLTKVCPLFQPYCACRLVGLSKNERYYFFVRGQGEMCVYDFVSQSVKRIQVTIPVGFHVVPAFYQESLVSVKGCSEVA